MQIDPKIIKKHFQKSLATYPENAVVQKITAEKIADLVKGKNFNSILEIGSGAGLLTEQIANKCKFTKYYANDLVEKSAGCVRKHIPNSIFIAGDFRNINPHKKFDLIISNAVFQWFNNPDKVIQKCSDMLETGGNLIFSNFLPDNFKEFKEVSGISLKYKSTEELRQSLEKYTEIITIEDFTYVMKFDNPLKILAHLKNTGVNSLSEKSWGIKEVKN